MTPSDDPTTEESPEEILAALCFGAGSYPPGQAVPPVDGRAEPYLSGQMADFVMLLGIRANGEVCVLRAGGATGEVVATLPDDTPPGTIVKDEWERQVVTQENPTCIWRKIGGTWVLISGSRSQCVLN